MDQVSVTSTNVDLPSFNAKPRCCITLDGVLSKDECLKVIDRSEQAGYHTALVNIGVGEIHDPDYRNSDRCIIDDDAFGKAVFDRIQSFLPRVFDDGNHLWELKGLNERMRILRYGQGHFFAAHRDGSYVRDARERSFLTAMIYINEGGGVGFRGGSTNFVSSNNERSEVVPKCGRVLVFDHMLKHEGAKIEHGTKYAIRTDVMYTRTRSTGSIVDKGL
jgi:hypothetical protein